MGLLIYHFTTLFSLNLCLQYLCHRCRLATPTMGLCCINIESAFGSREPLAPEIASMDVESAASPIARFNHAPDNITTTIPTSSGTHDSIATSPSSAGKEPSAVPSPGFITCPDYSKVVAFGSKALQPKATRICSPTIFPRNILSSILEHEDILYTLMLNCPNFATLFALVASCKKAKCAFEQHPHGIIKAILGTMSQELQHLTVALIEINGSRIGTSRSIKSNMEAWLGLDPKPRRNRLQVSNWPLLILSDRFCQARLVYCIRGAKRAHWLWDSIRKTHLRLWESSLALSVQSISLWKSSRRIVSKTLPTTELFWLHEWDLITIMWLSCPTSIHYSSRQNGLTYQMIPSGTFLACHHLESDPKQSLSRSMKQKSTGSSALSCAMSSSALYST